MSAPLALSGLGFPELLVVLLVAGGALAFWLWMIVDCINRETDPANKIAWLLVILLVGFVGAPLYFFVRKLTRPAARPAPAGPDRF